jgi:hypothetical protein
MIEAAQKIGQWIRKIVKSPVWKEIMGYSQDIRELPKMLMDETGCKRRWTKCSRQPKPPLQIESTVNEAVQQRVFQNVELVASTPGAGLPQRHLLWTRPSLR